MAFNPNQPRDPHGRFGEVAAHAAQAIAGVVSSTGNAATVARAISAVLKQSVAKGGKLDLTKFRSYDIRNTGGIGVSAWLGKMSKNWLGGNLLHSDEREDLLKYSDSSSVNRILRGLEKFPTTLNPLSEELLTHENHVMSLDSAIAKSRTNEDVHLYRGVGTLKRYGPPGEIYHDHGFVSASFDEGKAEGFASKPYFSSTPTSLKPTGGIAHIYVRKGLKALVLDGHSEHQREAEVLLPRDSKFRVLHYSDDNKHVHLEALGDE
jgi:hypothetical protein